MIELEMKLETYCETFLSNKNACEGCPKSHLTHRPIAKLTTGHSIALQREEIHFHAPEH